jgi:hypothetical protein
MSIPCQAFGDFLSRRSEHLDDEIIRSLHPMDTWVGHVSTGSFPAQAGVEHTFDRFENVWPDLTGQWEDVQAAACVGTPCDPAQKTIGLGFTRDSYRLQRKAFNTDLFCWDLILSADRAKQQFSHVIRTLRRCSSIVTSDRFRHEAVRIAGQKWATSNNTLTPITAYWDTTGTILNVSSLPTSKMTARHLQRRVHPQILLGALGEDINRGGAPMLEFVNDMESVWDIVEGSGELTDHWRFNDFADAEKFHKYGWTGRIGNYGMRADSMPLRFQNLGIVNSDGTTQLQLIFPYQNIAATEGIKEALNNDFENALIQVNFIWHRMAMMSLVRDATSINPEMPFASRDFAGKWQFAMDNLTCGTDVNGNPIAVDNSRRNKGKFLADFSNATKSEYPEFAEMFLTLREPACIVDLPTCVAAPYPDAQNYSSANAPCATTPITLTFLPILDPVTGTYEIARDEIECNGINIVHLPITGTNTLTNLVAQLNSLVGALGTWAVSGVNITLLTSSCSTVSLPWQQQ